MVRHFFSTSSTLVAAMLEGAAPPICAQGGDIPHIETWSKQSSHQGLAHSILHMQSPYVYGRRRLAWSSMSSATYLRRSSCLLARAFAMSPATSTSEGSSAAGIIFSRLPTSAYCRASKANVASLGGGSIEMLPVASQFCSTCMWSTFRSSDYNAPHNSIAAALIEYLTGKSNVPQHSTSLLFTAHQLVMHKQQPPSLISLMPQG